MAEAEAVTPQVEAPEQNAVPETPAPEQTQETTTRTYTQKELDEIVGKVKENQRRRRDELKRDLEAWRRVANERQTVQPAAPREPIQAQTDAGKPKQEAYSTYEDYMEALADWKATEKVKTLTEQQKREQQQREQQDRSAKLIQAHQERQTKAMAKYDDYEDIAFRNPHMTDAMIHAIVESELGPDIAYYLGQHQEESAKIAKLSPILAIKELGKIESKLEAATASPTPPKSSTAPPPITPVSGKATTASDEPSDNDDIGTWIKKRQKQVHGRPK